MDPHSEVIIDWIGGNCPVQAEGTVGGYPFYFRARGQKWTFEVADNVLYDSAKAWVAIFVHEESYGGGPYDAGWMTEDEALSFIAQAAERYLKEVFDEER